MEQNEQIQENTTQVESTNFSERRENSAEGKLLPALFSVLLLVLVLSPIVENWRAKPTDGFPLSHFPMFTSKRDKMESVTHLVGLDASGNRYVIPAPIRRNGRDESGAKANQQKRAK
ncbi:MAG TPA: hypothetical protein VNI84_06285 [Pyrinomonadaceae bacterium]|nr:hypothetical protein [Pyrinomonadaceae bacterium]